VALDGLGNSSGDENGSDPMKHYWEIIADNLRAKSGQSTVAANLSMNKRDALPLYYFPLFKYGK
jgi:hypothetical protein